MNDNKKESVQLNNGLFLNLYDASRKVAADRWLVKLEAAIEIAVIEDYFNDKTPMPAPIDQMRAKLGAQTTYTYQTERNFVDQQEKDNIFNQMQASLLAKKHYYDHPEFAGRFLIKEFMRRRHLPDTPH